MTNSPITIAKLADGNKQAIVCLVMFSRQGYSLQKFIDYNIMGNNINILFNICNHDYALLDKVLNTCPMESIQDTLFGIDQSGKKLLEMIEFD